MAKEYTRTQSIIGNIPALGPILLYDNFENNFRWTDNSGNDAKVIQSLSKPFDGSKSAYFLTDFANTAQAQCQFLTQVGLSNIIYCEFMFYLVTQAKMTNFKFELIYKDGVNNHTSGVNWLRATSKWQLFTDSGDFADLTGGGQSLYNGAWNRMAYAFDINTDKYTFFRCNNLTVDATGVSLFNEENGGTSYLDAFLTLIDAGAANAEAYVDSLLIRDD